MPTMCQQLQREEENLCAQRGLVQGQDTQTFSIFFHHVLLDKWRKLQTSQVGCSNCVFKMCFSLARHFTIFV